MTSLAEFGALGIDSHLHILGWRSDPRTRILPDFSKEMILPQPKRYKPHGQMNTERQWREIKTLYPKKKRNTGYREW